MEGIVLWAFITFWVLTGIGVIGTVAVYSMVSGIFKDIRRG